MRKNLVFSGVDLDDVRMELIKISTYCQDILEARVRSVLYDQLNITRDIPMDEVIRGKNLISSLLLPRSVLCCKTGFCQCIVVVFRPIYIKRIKRYIFISFTRST